MAKDWEAAFFAAPTVRTRKIAMRSAVILSPGSGGIFDLLSRIVRFGLGGQNASGNQYVSWVHGADFLRAVDFLILREDFSGIVNIASPNPLPNREFMRVLRRAWHIPIGLPAPRPAIGLGSWIMRTEPELVLKSRYVIPGRLLDAGFRFEFFDWPSAVRDLVHQAQAAASAS